MNTKSVTGVVLAFGLAFALLAGSGVGADVFGASPGEAETTRSLDEIGEEASVDRDDGGISADVTGDNEPSIVGVALSGGEFIVTLVGAVALLPVTLSRLGIPWWFATPVGGIAQIIAVIGLFQFVTGREYL